MFLAIPLGVLIGLAIGLLGAGGSILAVPVLVYGAGMPVHDAIPVALVVVGLAALAALVARRGKKVIRWPVALVFAGAGFPAAFAGAAAGRAVPEPIVMTGFAVLMVIVAVRMLRTRQECSGACRTGDGGVNWRSCLPKAIGTGALVGFLTGMFGVGGGFVIVPALALLLGLPAAEAVATSLVIIVVNAVAGLTAHLGASVDMNWFVTAVFAASAIAVALLTGRHASRLPEVPLRKGFAVLVLLVAAGSVAAALLKPELLSAASTVAIGLNYR
ncbi:sulfite exporter TauE/SafE family protein [Haloechinothrix sp. LS1_15]|uniref:sulfite exporter TauE/SafE family protein n=1 Tax=Haloechinothrix sp. LS1_15 TaxID=2652248 RepID=UPI002947230A|nr:sulfite exporter TauE/SafE family protein [Haloechinothrix sp. LS1_15]MDV6013795.1 sulfite exporter TauE/SafE family protein [Haloechinothrix sp. LS1_15]